MKKPMINLSRKLTTQFDKANGSNVILFFKKEGGLTSNLGRLLVFNDVSKIKLDIILVNDITTQQ